LRFTLFFSLNLPTMTSTARWPNKPLYTADFTGKTVMVVGASTGIGIEVAKHFAKMNATRVIATCRDEEKCTITADAIKKETESNNIEAWPLELSSFASVTTFVDRFEKDGGRLDYLVLNAAVALTEFTQTQDGWETQIQVNHLSGALLTLLLIPQLAKTAVNTGGHARVIVVSSGAHRTGDFSAKRIPNTQVLATLNDPTFPTRINYPDSKLMTVLFTRALTDHLPPKSPIIVTAVCPGFCHSELRRNIGDQAPFLDLLPHARTSEEGARQLIYAAAAGEAEGHLDSFRGGYVEHAEVASAGPWVLSEEGARVQDAFWKETLDVISNVSPKIQDVVKEYLSN